MNKKQKFCMWLGIIAICLFNLLFLRPWQIRIFYSLRFLRFWFIWVFGIALITGGLIITFAKKKDNKPKDETK